MQDKAISIKDRKYMVCLSGGIQSGKTLDLIKEALIKDFNEILTPEFCSDWEIKKMWINLVVNSMNLNNLCSLIVSREGIDDDI